MKKPKFIYAFLFFAVFIVEVLIALFVHDSFIRPFGGDIPAKESLMTDSNAVTATPSTAFHAERKES